MKKLLFVATASLCAAVFGAIESSNVVGYQNKSIGKDYNFVAPTFVAINGTAISSDAITLTGDGVTGYVDQIQKLDELGNTTATYTWDGAKWINSDYSDASFTIASGESVLLYSFQGGASVQFSGAVSKSDSTVTTTGTGFTFIGNSTPVTVNIADITLSGAATPYVDQIQTLDDLGNTEETYIWDGAGWITSDYAPADRSFAPGEGMLLYTFTAGVVVTIPAAL